MHDKKQHFCSFPSLSYHTVSSLSKILLQEVLHIAVTKVIVRVPEAQYCSARKCNCSESVGKVLADQVFHDGQCPLHSLLSYKSNGRDRDCV